MSTARKLLYHRGVYLFQSFYQARSTFAPISRPPYNEPHQVTSTITMWYPVAPLGTVPCMRLVCTSPVPSVTRASRVYLPGRVGSHCQDQSTHASPESGGSSCA